MIKTALHVLILLLALSLPFESIYPILVLPWFEFTNLELLAVAAVATWLLHILHSHILEMRSGTDRAARSLRVKADLGWPGSARQGSIRLPWAAVLPDEVWARSLIWFPVLFVSLSVLSATLAPVYQLDALKFVMRSAMGLTIFFMVIHTVRSHVYLVALFWAIVIGAGMSGFIGLAEAAGWSHFAPLLDLFKEAPTRVGGELRVSASFQYATIAAMFFEMTVPLALALAATAPTYLHRWAALAVALLGTANVVLSSTRAGMVTLACVLAIMLILAWRQPRFRPLLPSTLLVLGTLVFITGAFTLQIETFRTRLVTEDDLGWYGAKYTVPTFLRLTAGEPTTVTVAIQNTGTLEWHATGENPFALGYYWLVRGQALQESHMEIPLSRTVAPGETVDMSMMLQPSLPPGDYQLVWGMLQHDILWFRHRNVSEAHTSVQIEEGAEVPASLETAETIPGGDMPALPPTVRRLELWQAAVRMWAERPLLGVGPDNFRHLYGRYLNLSDWDRRLHANNLYLELLAGWGFAGTLALAGLVFVITRHWLQLWRSTSGALAIWSLGLGGSFLSFFIHGFLDYFFGFVSLYLLFWMVAGLIVTTTHNSMKGDWFIR